MRKWRVWQGSTEIQGDIQYSYISHPISSMAAADLTLSDPDFDLTITEGSNLNVFEGGNEISGENVGAGSSDGQVTFNTAHGTIQSSYMNIYIDGTASANEISYTRISTIGFETGTIVFTAGSTVGAGSTLYADYIYNGTGLFKGELERYQIHHAAGNNLKTLSVGGRDNLIDASYKSLSGGSWALGWTEISDENVGNGDGAIIRFNLANGSVAEDSLVLTTGSQSGIFWVGTSNVSDSRIDTISYVNGSITFHTGVTISNGSTLFADYRHVGGSTVELMVKKVCDAIPYTYEGTTIPATGVTTVCDVRGLTAFDAFKKLQEICGSTYEADFWLQPDDELFYFRDAESSGSAFTTANMKDNILSRDATDSYNKVTLYYQNDMQSVTKGSGTRGLVVHDRTCKYEQEAVEKARYIYAINSQSKISGKLIYLGWTTSQKLGDIISITDSATGQSAGSYTIKAINRSYSIDNRIGEVSYDYGGLPARWLDILKQIRDFSDYRETEIDRDKLTVSKSDQEHNELSGLQGGSTDQYYHLTLNDYNNIATGTTTKYCWVGIEKVSGNNILDYNGLRDAVEDWIVLNWRVPSDYDSGSVSVDGFWRQLDGGIGSGVVVVSMDWDKWVDHQGSAWAYAVGTVYQEFTIGTADVYYIENLGDVGTGGLTAGDVLRIEVRRYGWQGTDTFNQSMRVHGLGLQYTGKYLH